MKRMPKIDKVVIDNEVIVVSSFDPHALDSIIILGHIDPTVRIKPITVLTITLSRLLDNNISFLTIGRRMGPLCPDFLDFLARFSVG